MSAHACRKAALAAALAAALLAERSAASQQEPAPALANAPAPAAKHLAGVERQRVDAAIERGAKWLLARQDARGAFPPIVEARASEAALTAVALWALAPLPELPAERAAASTRFLLARRQPEGGLFDPSGGLRVYTSGVAAQAFRALPTPQARRFSVMSGILVMARPQPPGTSWPCNTTPTRKLGVIW